MIYAEDLKRIFGETADRFVGSEITIYGSSALVITGHRGLSSLTPEEIVVRRRGGSVTVLGRGLRLLKAGPEELYISGEICSISYLENAEVSD